MRKLLWVWAIISSLLFTLGYSAHYGSTVDYEGDINPIALLAESAVRRAIK